ncbi:hypothetical protein HPB49_002312 [Dermacentor silvarum]|uniref:Uncharacterized protein n=1 Tax=Dermacentor silvarum TaxID=543639 RepID=A0ACB8DST3_DERSI|nr:hypothetical protein HPB49_002312 [Dermacentor silvarum]
MAKGPRVSIKQTAILLQFIEQHPYLARASTELSPRMAAARSNELWEELATILNKQGPAVKTVSRRRNHWAKLGHKTKKEAARAASEKRATGGDKVHGIHGRVLDVLGRTAAVLVSAPQFFTDCEVRTVGRKRQATQQKLETPSAERLPSIRQGQSAEARAIEEASFRQQLLQKNQQLGARNKWVHFPKTSEKKAAVKEGFLRRGDIPGVIGCVDGSLIAIVAPKGERKAAFMCRKGYYALNWMFICDADLRILAVDPMRPGSDHD